MNLTKKNYLSILFLFFLTMKLSSLNYDFFSFIISVCSTIFISNKIEIQYNIIANPINNLIFLLLGTFLSCFTGTTIASILFLKPMLKINSNRKYIFHTQIFFIFMVSNVGGSLTPLGDPPLFFGYLEGIPFGWTFKLAPEFVMAILVLTSTYFLIDFMLCKYVEIKYFSHEPTYSKKNSIRGKINFIWLFGILILSIFFRENFIPLIKENQNIIFMREAILILLVISYSCSLSWIWIYFKKVKAMKHICKQV